MAVFRLFLLLCALGSLALGAAVAALAYGWSHFPPMDWERLAPVVIAGAVGVGVILLIVRGLVPRGRGAVASVLPYPMNNDG